ncbi:MAG TPA: response regulator [Myxococcota bacterium]|nr:response regulator [Myxococcota bacterium]
MGQGTLELLPDGILQLDADGRVVYANRIAQHLLGGDPVGSNVARLRAGKERDQDGLKMGVWRRLDGGIAELESSTSQHGAMIFVALRDMSERATTLTALRDERNQMQAVLEALHSLIVVFGKERRVLRVNAAVTRATGVAERRLLGDPTGVLGLIDPEDRDWVASGLGRAMGGESVVGDVRLLGPQGPRAYEAQLEPLAGQGALLLCRSITRERELLGVFRAQARKEVAELSLLAGSMAHDINDALTVIASALDSLPAVHGHAAEALVDAEKALRKSRRATRDMLHLGRREELEHGPVNLGNLLARVVERLAEAAPSGVTVRCENGLGSVRVIADPSGVIKILHQLGVNAIRAVGLEGEIWFRGHELDGDAILDIEDDGVGIPTSIQGRLFQPFTRHASQRPVTGLALVRGLVQSYGGTIQVQSSPEAGTLFRVLLPVYERGTTVTRIFDDDEVIDLPGSVLLVEDNDAVRHSLASLLGSHDVVVHSAADGLEALRMADKLEGIELVLLDIGMPGLGGEEVLQRLKHRHPDLPVLMMSGFAREEKVQACIDAGALGFVSKPFRLAELCLALDESRE